MRLIPGKTKVKMELFKGVSLTDILIGTVFALLIILVLISNLPAKFMICLGVLMVAGGLLMRMDEVPNYFYLLHILRHFSVKRSYKKTLQSEVETKKAKKSSSAQIQEITAFTGIEDDFIEYGKSYFGAAIEIPPIEFRFFSENRRRNSIENGLGRILRSVNPSYAANIVKLERPINYDRYVENEQQKMEELKRSYESGFFNEEELRNRIGVLRDRMEALQRLRGKERVLESFFYLVLFDSDKKQLKLQVDAALESLRAGEMVPHRLKTKELAVFLRYTGGLDFDEREIETIDPVEYASWAMNDSVQIKFRTVEVNRLVTHNFRMMTYPSEVGDAWMAGLMSVPNTKVVMKCTPIDRSKAVRSIDRSLQELRDRFMNTGVDSRKIELQDHIDTLSYLLTTLQGENEALLSCNIYVTAYDVVRTAELFGEDSIAESALSKITGLKKAVRRTYQESGFRLNNMEFDQMTAFLGGQVSGYDPLELEGRGMPSNSIAAAFPWIYAHINDEKGIRLGTSEGVPVFVDFFARNAERVNSNMVIVGKSGSGKSFATKMLLANLAADDSKIFILDPENEYSELAENLHGKFINVGNAQYGRLNPFHIITSLDDDETQESTDMASSYATHLQFLEEFFRQILPDCEKDAMEYLNSLVDRMYTNRGITSETNLSTLRPEDYPIFDDLYDTILEEFQSTDNSYIRRMLRTLINYVSKFSTGGRNAALWNGPSSVTTEENFSVFNFQSLLANRNGTIANAQMLLVLKYIDNEIIKNRDYNTKYHLNRKIVVVIDEAHVFIDTKFPIALDFMFQLAKRIRKYNGMQIVITQNIKDFVGSEEIARKSTAIINACQYSFIFSLAPNDMDDLCRLYEKSGGINENEQEQIVQAARGQVFTVMSPTSRTSFRVEAPKKIVRMFSERGVEELFETDAEEWNQWLGESRELHDKNTEEKKIAEEASLSTRSHVVFEEIDAETANAEAEKRRAEKKEAPQSDDDFGGLGMDLFDDFDIPDDPEEFMRLKAAKEAEKAQTQGGTAGLGVPSAPAPAYDGGFEKVVSKLGDAVDQMSRFSYEGVMREVQRMIMEGRTLEKTPEAAAEEEEKKASAVALGRIGEPEDAPELLESDEFEGTEEQSEDDIFSFDNDFDIMALLAQSTQEGQQTDPIEMMSLTNQTVITVSLEELAQYILKNK